MIYGDLGRFPLSILIKKRIIGYWYKLINNHSTLSSTIYKIIVNDVYNNNSKYSWLSNVKSILDECGLSYIWDSQSFHGSKDLLLTLVERSLKDQFVQNWNNIVNNSNKAINYRMFKTEFKLEDFYLELSDTILQPIINYRLCNNHLPVELGRFQNIERNARRCSLCNSTEIGDEFHYLFHCSFFDRARRLYLPNVTPRNANIFHFQRIMCENDFDKLKNISIFFQLVMKTV